MSNALHEHPDPDQLRRRAKELRDATRAGDPAALARYSKQAIAVPRDGVTLASAQLVVARELGFASWPKLKAAVDLLAASPDRRAFDFLEASIDGPIAEAVRLLELDPGVAGQSLVTAAVVGDVQRVRGTLVSNPASAVEIDEARGWPPVLYVCYSRWPQVDRGRAANLVEIARLLLDAGASPDTNNGARPHRGYRSALHGSVVANNPGITELLLQRGADPNDGESLYQAARRTDHRCLRALLAHGATVAGTWALEVAVHADDSVGVSLLLDAAAHEAQATHLATRVLADAASTASPGVVRLLLRAGADVAARDAAGMSALRRAVRAGRNDTATILLRHGASQEATDVDRFIGACMLGDRAAVRRLLATRPDVRDQFTDQDRGAIVEGSGAASATAVAVMLEVGFSPRARNEHGVTALHTAAYAGNAEAVRLLIGAGAEVEARDSDFDATPLAFATVGSGERVGQPGSWLETVRLLLDAGARTHGVWVSGKPPSDDVARFLRRSGISEGERAVEGSPATEQDASSRGSGVIADVAEHLEAAYRSLDFDILESLLHPQVLWGRGPEACHSSVEVIAWHRRIIAEGTRPTIKSLEVSGQSVVVGLALTRQAEDARPAPAERTYKVFTVADAQIVEIQSYPDRANAIANV